MLQTIYFTYTFDEIAETSPCSRGLTFVIGDSETPAPSVLFVTKDALQIHQLIADYRRARYEQEPPLIERAPNPKNIKSSPATRHAGKYRSPKSKSRGGGGSGFVKNKGAHAYMDSTGDDEDYNIDATTAIAHTHSSADRIMLLNDATSSSIDRLTQGGGGSSGRLADASGDAASGGTHSSVSQGLSQASTSYLADSMQAVFSDRV